MGESEFVILDHYSTTFLEVIKLGIPFILILDKKYIYLTKLKNPFFKELVRNKIVHLSEKSASKFLNKIYGKHIDWWNSIKIKNSISKFKKNNFGDEKDFIKILTDMTQ